MKQNGCNKLLQSQLIKLKNDCKMSLLKSGSKCPEHPGHSQVLKQTKLVFSGNSQTDW